ncbi:hypothetical protein [Dankookia sp. P2]|uniref:hypothetical protein n=1 Tax=Dankookia sp. P2 TaxID=3423955 RepID=UPI003D6777F0
MNAEVARILALPEVAAQLGAQGFEPVGGAPRCWRRGWPRTCRAGREWCGWPGRGWTDPPRLPSGRRRAIGI